MRPFRLARIAAEAEGLRLRRRFQRTAVGAALGVVALAFVIFTITFAHIAAWYWLRLVWQGQYVALTLGGVDLALALLLGLLATRSSPSRVEQEALVVRQRALDGARASIAFTTLAMQLLRVASNVLARRR
jgi:hypothetical protein